MNIQKVGRTILIVIAVLVGLLIVIWATFKIAAPDLVRERAESNDGNYAEVVVDGVPLSDGLRVLVWRAGWPRIDIFSCNVLESYHEQPVKLSWSGNAVTVRHAFEVRQIVHLQSRCGDVPVRFTRTLKPYS